MEVTVHCAPADSPMKGCMVFRCVCTGLLMLRFAGALAEPAPTQEPASTLEWRAYRNFTSAEGLPEDGGMALLQDAEGYV